MREHVDTVGTTASESKSISQSVPWKPSGGTVSHPVKKMNTSLIEGVPSWGDSSASAVWIGSDHVAVAVLGEGIFVSLYQTKTQTHTLYEYHLQTHPKHGRS